MLFAINTLQNCDIKITAQKLRVLKNFFCSVAIKIIESNENNGSKDVLIAKRTLGKVLSPIFIKPWLQNRKIEILKKSIEMNVENKLCFLYFSLCFIRFTHP